MLRSSRQHGVSLVELVIGIAVLSILLSVALPSFSLWIQNTQIRTAAESIQNGLHLARSEAVRRNSPVQFQLTNASGLVDWTVGCVTVVDDCPNVIQSRTSAEGTANVRIGVGTTATGFATPITAAGTPTIVFNALGRLAPPPAAGTSIRVDVRHATMSDARRLVVLVSGGGRIRMCDPALSMVNNAQGCD